MKTLRPYSLNRNGGLLLPLYILSVAVSLLLGLFWPLRMFGNYKINHVTNVFLLLRSKVVWRLPPSKVSSFKLLATRGFVECKNYLGGQNQFLQTNSNFVSQFAAYLSQITDLTQLRYYFHPRYKRGNLKNDILEALKSQKGKTALNATKNQNKEKFADWFDIDIKDIDNSISDADIEFFVTNYFNQIFK